MTADITLHSGRMLTNVHPEEDCFLEHCCIHSPSDHPLNAAPLEWVGELRAMFRVCPHDQLHPDPDDLTFMLANWRFIEVEAITSVHLVDENCDGCCR